MQLGYNTNGTAHHRWDQAIELMAEIGYQSVAITVDHNCLNPFSPELPAELKRMRQLLERLNFSSIIETGARFLLDPRHKHEPTLVSPLVESRKTRIDFLKRCITIAKELNSNAVSFWSGIVQAGVSRDDAMKWLAEGCRQVLDFADQSTIHLAFEPEPGMLIQTFDDYRELIGLVDGAHFGLTIDIGHVHCLEPKPISDYLIEWRDRIFTIHIEDMYQGVHDHLRFGQGTIDFPPILATLNEIGYSGALNVELSRHSHMAPDVMRESYHFLSSILNSIEKPT